MKSFTVSLLALASFATSSLVAPARVNAMPVWATSIARSHCEYLAMGAKWDDAIRQSLRDNLHWLSEFNAAGDLGTKAVVYSINNTCPTLNDKAFKARGFVGTSTSNYFTEL